MIKYFKRYKRTYRQSIANSYALQDNKFATKNDIEKYFKRYKRVRSVTIADATTPGLVDIYVKSWILLKEEQLENIKMLKPLAIHVRIHNHSLFKKTMFEF